MRFLNFLLALLFVVPTFGAATRTIDGDTIRSSDASKTYSLPSITGPVMVSTGLVQEVPTGTVNGTNLSFTLSFSPAQTASVEVYVNGLLQKQTTHYTISGSTITFTSGNAPATASDIVVSYSRF